MLEPGASVESLWQKTSQSWSWSLTQGFTLVQGHLIFEIPNEFCDTYCLEYCKCRGNAPHDRKEQRTLPAVLMGLSALPISLRRWLYWLLCPIALLLSTSYLENNSIILLSINRHESQNVKPRWKIAKRKKKRSLSI